MNATTIAAMLAAMLIPSGVAEAQQWNGVAAIAATRGYSASPAMGWGMSRGADPRVDPAPEDRAAAPDVPAAPRPQAPAMRVAAEGPAHAHRHHVRTARVRTSPAMMARAKRPGIHHRARIA